MLNTDKNNDEFVIDHININKYDNRRENLRLVDSSTNSHNKNHYNKHDY